MPDDIHALTWLVWSKHQDVSDAAPMIADSAMAALLFALGDIVGSVEMSDGMPFCEEWMVSQSDTSHSFVVTWGPGERIAIEYQFASARAASTEAANG